MIGNMRMSFIIEDGCRKCKSEVLCGLLRELLNIASVVNNLIVDIEYEEFLLWEVKLCRQKKFFLECKISRCISVSSGCSNCSSKLEAIKKFKRRVYVLGNSFQISTLESSAICPIKFEELVHLIAKDLSL